MDKRYQVFVSSTYADLKEERQHVIQTLLKLDCIPSGMELFPATDEEQFEFIKKVIDDCDYYLLIIGGRYGSVTPEGLSYTEKEYEYALEKQIKVMAFLHAEPEEIPLKHSEKDPELRAKLELFRSKVSKNRLVQFWKRAEDLPGLVALSVLDTTKRFPAQGWVRAGENNSIELLSEINQLRKAKEELTSELEKYRNSEKVVIPNLASLEEKLEITGEVKYAVSYGRFNKKEYQWKSFKEEISWMDTFYLISPYIQDGYVDSSIKLKFEVCFAEKFEFTSINLDDQIYQTIKIQLQALGLVEVKSLKTTQGGYALFWVLTSSGKNLMLQIRTIRSNNRTE